MKKILAILLFAVIGCGNEPEKTQQEVLYNDNWQGFNVVVIDSCEYIVRSQGGYVGYLFSHKGNCKFCKERCNK